MISVRARKASCALLLSALGRPQAIKRSDEGTVYIFCWKKTAGQAKPDSNKACPRWMGLKEPPMTSSSTSSCSIQPNKSFPCWYSRPQSMLMESQERIEILAPVNVYLISTQVKHMEDHRKHTSELWLCIDFPFSFISANRIMIWLLAI